MTYKYLEQRMAQTYIDMFPKFIPDVHAQVTVPEQKDFYDIMRNLYQLAFDEPLLFVTKLNEDDIYPNKMSIKAYNKPKLILNMKKFRKAVNIIVQELYVLGQDNEIKLNKRSINILSRLGLNDFSKLPPALVWMAKRDTAIIVKSLPIQWDASHIHHAVVEFAFSHFNKEHSYTYDFYSRLFDDKAFLKIITWMEKQGYKRYEFKYMDGGDFMLSLTYANPIWSPGVPNKSYFYKIKHTGIAMDFNPYKLLPQYLGLCIPKGLMKTMLENTPRGASQNKCTE